MREPVRLKRRACLRAGAALGLAALLVPMRGLAGPRPKVFRIGTMSMGVASEPNDMYFTEALRELGYVEGKNIVIERRFAQADASRLPQMAAQLVRLGVDLIYVSSTAPTQAAIEATHSTPIIFVNVADPVGSGFVASLGRPGANATGISVASTELSAKRVQLLKESFPRSARLAVFVTPEPAAQLQLAEVRRAAKMLGLKVLAIEFKPGAPAAQAMAMARAWRADALFFTETSQNFFNRDKLTDIAARLRLPAIFGSNYYAEAGGLMSYGSNYAANYRRAANYVDKVLQGAKPSELPVEQPTVYEFILNLKAAKQLGLVFPETILLRADKTID